MRVIGYSYRTFDIVADALNHKLTVGNFFFNAVLFTPLLVRNWRVYIVAGIISIMFALYALFAILIWFGQFLDGAHFRYAVDTFVIGPIFISFTLLSGLSLVYAGWRWLQAAGSMSTRSAAN